MKKETESNISLKENMEIEFISRNEDGNFYVGLSYETDYKIKSKPHREIMIIGMNKNRWNKWLKENWNQLLLPEISKPSPLR